jgi:hypothetical protein
MPGFKAGESPTGNWYAPKGNRNSMDEGGGAGAFDIGSRLGGFANLQTVRNGYSQKRSAKDPAASRRRRKGLRGNEANQYRDNIIQSG